MPWAWDAGTARYRDAETGQFIARDRVLAAANESLDAAAVATETLAGMASQGILSPSDWRDMMREEIKQEYITQYLAGRGGRDQMTQADWGSVGGMVREQYRFLDGMAGEIPNLTEAQIAARSRMYTTSANEAFERAHRRAVSEAGMTEELWVIDPAAENCPDCVAFASEGWQPLDHFPMPGAGDTVCLTNCQCHKTYRNPETGAAS